MQAGRYMLFAGLSALLAGCSFQNTLDRIADPARQAEMVKLARTFCTDPASLSPRMYDDLRGQFDAVVAKLPSQCPAGPAEWRLVSYRFNWNQTNGGRTEFSEVIVVAQAKTDWTTVDFQLMRTNQDSEQFLSFNLVKTKERPPAQVFVDNWDKGRASMLKVGLGVAALLGIGLALWIIRRRRRAASVES